MNKRLFIIVVLVFFIGSLAHSEVVFTGSNRASLTLSGEFITMFSLGLQDDSQTLDEDFYFFESGVFYGNGSRNGYLTQLDFNVLFKPVPYVDLSLSFLSLYWPGSPYIPLQLKNWDEEIFSFSAESFYAKIDIIKAFNDKAKSAIWFKGGMFETEPSYFNTISRYGTENVMNMLRTDIGYSMLIAYGYHYSPESIFSLGISTNLKLQDEVPVYNDEEFLTGDTTIPLFVFLTLKERELSFGTLSMEMIYAYNAMNIFSGHNFGFGFGLDINIIDSSKNTNTNNNNNRNSPTIGRNQQPVVNNSPKNDLSLRIGAAGALYEKYIDTLAGTVIMPGIPVSDTSTDSIVLYNSGDTFGFGQALRIGGSFGIHFTQDKMIDIEFNSGFAFSKIEHIHRNPLNIMSLSFDLQSIFLERFIYGGGLFLGTLTDVKWEGDFDNINVFKPGENMGFEIFCGIKLNDTRIIAGFNKNKGLSMNNHIESMPEAQNVYKQKDNDLFEMGGVFVKMVVSW